MEVESAADVKVFGQRFQDAMQHTGAHPLLEATMTGLVGRVPFGQVGPRSTGTQDIQNPVEHFAAAFPGPSAAILAALGFRNQGIKQCPLSVSQVSGVVGRHLLR